ncbi:MAG: ABC transporter permease [Oscillospiraceae bacterium]|nr:ABC transporter permease [Oscillospiraceae bacterium]
MRDILTVFKFTLKDNVRKKAFIITTVLVLVLIFAACSIPAIISRGDSGDSGDVGAEPGDEKKNYTCYLLDQNSLVPGALEALSLAFSDVEFTKGEPNKISQYKNIIENDKSVALLEILEGEIMPSLRFTVTDFMSGTPTDAMAKVIEQVYVSDTLKKAGVSEQQTKLALSDITYTVVSAGKMDATGYALGVALTLLMFFSIYYYGYGVSMSVASEKTSRVMETLIVSAKPSRILLGKCLAMGTLGLLQLSVFIIAAALGYTFLVPNDFTISGVPLALSSFTPISALLILVYFLLGYSLYAMINSVCGSTVSRIEDLQSAMMPSVLVSLISFYSAYMVLFLPNQTIRRVISYIPFTSSFIMPFRLLNETVAAQDIVISIVLLIVAIIVVSTVSVRLYSASVMHYGQRLKIRDLFRLSK